MIKRFFEQVLIGMAKGVIVALVIALFAGLWWLDHVRFVF